MSEPINVMKWIKRFIKEDLRVIATFLVVILFIVSGFTMMMGFLAIENTDFRTPSSPPFLKSGLSDTDSDSLPDIIEGTPDNPCEPGDTVRDQNGAFRGYCTGSDFRDVDSDNDGFTDAVEDAIGTNPNNFFFPGFVYFIFLAYLGTFIFFQYYKGDPLKEYKEFEMKTSSGVSGGGSKFAHGGSSVFGQKSAKDATEEERKQAIAQDSRFQRMTAEGGFETEKFEKKRNWGVLGIQLAIAIILSVFVILVFRAS